MNRSRQELSIDVFTDGGIFKIYLIAPIPWPTLFIPETENPEITVILFWVLKPQQRNEF